jgi:hypothetical protein
MVNIFLRDRQEPAPSRFRSLFSQRFTAASGCFLAVFVRCFSLLFCLTVSPKARKSAARARLPAVFFGNNSE